MYKYLNFFNKKGEYCNFTYDETNDKWIGRVDFGTVSEGIAEDFQLYLLTEVYNTNDLIYEMSYPHIDTSLLPGLGSPVGPTGATADSIKVTAYFDASKPVEDLFIYDFEIGGTSNILNKVYSMDYEFIYDVNQTITGGTGSTAGMYRTTVSPSNPLQINLGFIPSSENGFSSNLYIKDISGHIFAEVLLYGEGEEEDERLKDLLTNMGQDLLPSDVKIFDVTDVNEEGIDWEIINTKRKELLLEYSNIFPYLGSYKALINIIKYFGYQNLRMKEYWLNVDAKSPYFGKYKQINITDVFDESANYVSSGLVPSKIYKKTNKFGLFYDITIPSGEFDEDGIPLTEEVFTFSPHEILIKIFALKKKLQNYFLPVNAKIVDIIGEAVYFAKYETNVWNDQYRIDGVNLGLKPSFTVLPSPEGYLEDIRALYFFGCPVGPDLSIGGSSNILSWRVGLSTNNIVTNGVLDSVQTYRLIVEIPTASTPVILDTIIKTDPDTGQYTYEPYEVIDKIIDNWRLNSYLNNNFVVYQEGGNSGILRIVQLDNSTTGNGTIYATWFSNTGGVPGGQFSSVIPPGPAGGTVNSINISTGPSGSFGPSGAPMSYYGDCFLGYFDRMNIDVRNLNDDEDIPIGYPIVLRNDTFNITWDDANVTFNQIDKLDFNTNGLLYSRFINSYTISGYTSIYPNPGLPTGATYLSIPQTTTVSGFPISSFPSSNNYSWINIGYYGYYEMQWIVSKAEDETPAYYYDSGVGSMMDLNSLPLILPYVGSYRVELYLWDGYNTKSFLLSDDVIQVKIKDSDFIGWYQYRELDYNLDTKRYPVQSDYARMPFGIPPKNEMLSWDDYASTWELPLHPNEEIGMSEISFNSLDSIEFYQSINNPSDNPLIDRYPYTFNLMTPLPNWNELYHLWWDGTGTTITQFEIYGGPVFVPGPPDEYISSPISIARANSKVPLNGTHNSYVFAGPTGFTGATASYSSTAPFGGTSGDWIYISSNKAAYRDNGTEWVRQYNPDIDRYECIIPPLGTLPGKEFMIRLADYLNSLPEDSVFSDFIYYYEEKYGPAYQTIPYVKAVSKNFQRGGRHRIQSNLRGDEGFGIAALTINDNIPSGDYLSSGIAYRTVYFGYLGDIPTSFEIYQVSATGPTGTILFPGATAPYVIGSTNLTDLCNELNGPTAQSYNSIAEYQFNLVLGYSGMSGPSGPTGGMQAVKVQAIARAFTSPQEIEVSYTGGIIGTPYGRSLIRNITWDQVRVLKYAQNLPLCTVVNFTYDNSKVPSKKNPKWKLTKEGDLDFTDIYYNNKYFSYMFTERGSYSLSLEVEDTNGNKQTVTKKEIIKII